MRIPPRFLALILTLSTILPAVPTHAQKPAAETQTTILRYSRDVHPLRRGHVIVPIAPPETDVPLPEGLTKADVSFGLINMGGTPVRFAYMRHRKPEMDKYVGTTVYMGGRLFVDSNGNRDYSDDPEGVVESSSESDGARLIFDPVPFTRTVNGMPVHYLLRLVVYPYFYRGACFIRSGWRGNLQIGDRNCSIIAIDPLSGEIGEEDNYLVIDPSETRNKRFEIGLPMPKELFLDGQRYSLSYRFVESDGEAAVKMACTGAPEPKRGMGRLRVAGQFVQVLGLSTNDGESALLLHPEGDVPVPAEDYTVCRVNVFNPLHISDFENPLGHVYRTRFAIDLQIRDDRTTTLRIGAPLYNAAQISAVGTGATALSITPKILGQSGHRYWASRTWDSSRYRIMRQGEVIEQGDLQRDDNMGQVHYSAIWEPTPDTGNDVQVAIDRDLSGVGPHEGLATPIPSDKIESVQKSRRQKRHTPYVLVIVFVLPLVLLLIPANRQRQALWILAPHGLVAAMVVTMLLTGHFAGRAFIVAVTASALATIWLGAAVAEGENRLLAALLGWLTLCAFYGAAGLAREWLHFGTRWFYIVKILLPALAPALAFLAMTFWLRWSHRWWRFLIFLILSWTVIWTLVQIATIVFAMAYNGLQKGQGLGTSVNLVEIFEILKALPRYGSTAIGYKLVIVLPYVVLALAVPFFRDRLFAIYRRPGTPPPQGFENWRDFCHAVNTPRSRAVLTITLLISLLCVLALFGFARIEPLGTHMTTPTRPSPPHIGPNTPIEDQCRSPLIPPMPEGITPTTYPTDALPKKP